MPPEKESQPAPVLTERAGHAARVPLVAIVGPTASGKSALAMRLAGQLRGEILVCDSTQVYRGFDIGTSKPSEADRRAVRHHLLDLVDPGDVFTAGDFRHHAMSALAEVRQAGRLPILTAGTGLYLRALLEGLAAAPLRSEDLRERLRRSAERRKPGYLHRVLARMDRAAAARIAPRDTPKLIRAIEVCVLSGKPISEVHKAERPALEGFRAIKIGLTPPRTKLYERIERRTMEMLEHGWIEEVRGLVARGVPPNAKAFSFIGYAALRAHVHEKGELRAVIPAIQQATRRYAKRQMTWFRKEPGVRWYEGFGDDAAISQQVLSAVRRELETAGGAAAGADAAV